MPLVLPPFAPDATLKNIVTTLQGLTLSLQPYKVNLTREQVKRTPAMSTSREGYVRKISQIAKNHIESLPREHNPAELESLLDYYSNLGESYQAILTLLETIAETRLATSMVILKTASDYRKALQISRNNSGSLDLSMRELDEWALRFGGNKKSNKKPDCSASHHHYLKSPPYLRFP